MSDFKALNELVESTSIHKNPEEYLKMQCNKLNSIEKEPVDGYNCRKCKNKGYIGIIKDGEVLMKQCECAKARESIRNMKNSGLESVIRDCTFETYNTDDEWQKTLKEKAQKFCADKEAKWFFVGGQSGAGKSHICTAITASFLRKGIPCKYMKWIDESRVLKAHVNSYDYEEMIDTYKEIEVLYLDDFLKTQSGLEPTGADMILAFEILNSRYCAKKVTIISSEYTTTKALEFDEATIGRIIQMTGTYCVNIPQDISKNYRIAHLIKK